MLASVTKLRQAIAATLPLGGDVLGEAPSTGQAARPDNPDRGVLALATAPPRLVAELLLALPYVVAQLAPLVQDARILVGELTRLARGTNTGALNDVLAELSRLAAEDGELTALLRDTAELARTRAEEGPVRPAAGERG